MGVDVKPRAIEKRTEKQSDDIHTCVRAQAIK